MWYSFLQIHAKCKVMLFYNWPSRNHQFRDFILFLNFICGFLWFQTLLRVFWRIFLLLLIFREFSYCSFFYSLKLKEIKIMKWSRNFFFFTFFFSILLDHLPLLFFFNFSCFTSNSFLLKKDFRIRYPRQYAWRGRIFLIKLVKLAF